MSTSHSTDSVSGTQDARVLAAFEMRIAYDAERFQEAAKRSERLYDNSRDATLFDISDAAYHYQTAAVFWGLLEGHEIERENARDDANRCSITLQNSPVEIGTLARELYQLQRLAEKFQEAKSERRYRDAICILHSLEGPWMFIYSMFRHDENAA